MTSSTYYKNYEQERFVNPSKRVIGPVLMDLFVVLGVQPQFNLSYINESVNKLVCTFIGCTIVDINSLQNKLKLCIVLQNFTF